MEFLIYKELYDDLKLRYSQINEYLDLSDLIKKIDFLKDKTLKENFWEDKHSASKILKQISRNIIGMTIVYGLMYVVNGTNGKKHIHMNQETMMMYILMPLKFLKDTKNGMVLVMVGVQ